ncbi:MAG: tetratricopeptide repeat protein [bacterium]
MKIMKLIKASILLCLLPVFAIANNSFKDGNANYLQGDYAKAMDGYAQFIKNKPNYFEGYYNAGNALYRQEQYENALKMYNKAQELNPKDEDTKINIQLTEKKIKQKDENKDKKDNKQDKGKDGKDSKDQQGKGQESKGKNGKGQEQKNQQAGQTQQNSGAGQGQKKAEAPADPQKQLGMSADEVQALMNMTQKSEKEYKSYFGKQNNKNQQQNDFQNVFNMSPQEIHNYMMRQMMNPNEVQQAPQKSNSKEKDW